MPQVFLNNATGEVAQVSNFIPGQTSVDVDATLAAQLATINFATDFILLTFTEAAGEASWEITKCTGLSGTTITVVRAQEGTAQGNWAQFTKVEARVTEGSMERARNQVLRLLTDQNGGLLTDQSGEIILGQEV